MTAGTSVSNEADLVRLNSALTQLMRRMREVDARQGAGRARLSALAVLRFRGPCTASELAELELVSRATMHHVLAGLEHDGLIRRSPDPADARRRVVSLSARGRARIDRAHRARIDYLRGLTRELGPGRLHTVSETLDAIRNAANSRVAPLDSHPKLR